MDKNQIIVSLDKAEALKIVNDLNRNHAVVPTGGKTVILTEFIDPATGYKDIKFGTLKDLQLLMRNKPVFKQVKKEKKIINPADVWAGHAQRRQYQGVVFMPNETCNGFYNTWQGLAVQAKEGDCGLYKDHLLNNICNGDQDHYEYVFDWMADCIQNPAEKPGTAIVLRGAPGTGKGIYASEFGRLLGPHFLHLSSQKHLTGRFNFHLKATLLAFLDEAFWAGSKRDSGALKALITEKTILLEAKYADPFQIKNHVRCIFASNADWVVPAELQERRFLVLDVSDAHRMDIKYFKALKKQMRTGGREALLYELKKRVIGSNLRIIPRTDALYDQIVNSMDSVQRWWVTCLHTGQINDRIDAWPERMTKKAVFNAYRDYCEQERIRPKKTYDGFFRALYGLCPVISRVRATGEGRPWTLAFPYIEQARELFEKKIGIKIKWSEFV